MKKYLLSLTSIIILLEYIFTVHIRYVILVRIPVIFLQRELSFNTDWG